MYVDGVGVIFVHVPKTAGNYIQHHLLPHSRDRKSTDETQDGVDRYSIDSRFGLTKHASLLQYRQMMPPALFAAATTLSVVRDPVRRMLSWFFSPGRHLQQLPGGGRGYVRPTFSLAAFESFVAPRPAAVDFLRLDGRFVHPDRVIRYERLHEDTEAVFGELGLPVPTDRTPVNASLERDRIEELSHEPDVAAVCRAHHAEDFEAFGYG